MSPVSLSFHLYYLIGPCCPDQVLLLCNIMSCPKYPFSPLLFLTDDPDSHPGFFIKALFLLSPFLLSFSLSFISFSLISFSLFVKNKHKPCIHLHINLLILKAIIHFHRHLAQVQVVHIPRLVLFLLHETVGFSTHLHLPHRTSYITISDKVALEQLPPLQ